MPTDQPDRLLDVREAADRLGVSEAVVRPWLRSGRLRGTLLADDRGWRVAETEVERLRAATIRARQPDAR